MQLCVAGNLHSPKSCKMLEQIRNAGMANNACARSKNNLHGMNNIMLTCAHARKHLDGGGGKPESRGALTSVHCASF